jgi:hypothetical protein
MDRLYGAPCVVFTHVSMAGEANEEPVPLIGAGVVLALTASEVFFRGDDLKTTGPLPFTEVVVVVVVTPVAPVVLVVVLLGLPVLVVAPSAPAAVPTAATARADNTPTPVTRRHHSKVFKSP